MSLTLSFKSQIVPFIHHKPEQMENISFICLQPSKSTIFHIVIFVSMNRQPFFFIFTLLEYGSFGFTAVNGKLGCIRFYCETNNLIH